ncbi:hypothetical protein FRC03_012087 [Tulasnella sp. 419]|nr:hypothetical protein FRC03_012087 [Tulasnella sp. 419]
MDNCDDKSRSERLARTGTFCFMAWQILDDIQESGTQDEESPKGPLHSYKHDLQSFFWVLLYICAGSPSFTSKPLDRRHPSIKVMNIFSELKWEVASVLKKVYLTDRAKIWVAEPFKGMLSVLSRMQALLSPGNWDSLTHDAFISILDEALQDPNVQERALILQHKFEPPYLKPRYPTSGPIKTYQGPTLKSKHPGVPTLANHRSSASGLHMMTHSRTSKEPSGKESLVRNFVSRKRNADPPTYSRESKRSREA